MTRRLVLTYFIITALALAMLAIPLGATFARREKDRFLFDLERAADGISGTVADPIAQHRPVPNADVVAYARKNGGHVVVVDANGRALVDTDTPTQPGRDYSQNRPEIRDALHGQRADGSRYSADAHTTLLYVAVPVESNGRVSGAVRITYPQSTLDARVRKVWEALALLCVAVLTVVVCVGFVLARSVVRPVRRLEDATDRFASGDTTARVDQSAGPPELRNLAGTFNRMAARLERLLDAQQRFVADASHQLRTPLTALRLRIENLDAYVSDRDRPAIEAAAAEVTRMSRLVDGLLLLARDDAGTTSHPIDVATVARDRADVWNDVARERDVKVDAFGPESAWALAVPGAVEQLVDNLIDNAITVTAPGTAITVRVEQTATSVVLHVEDRGPGLSAEDRARAFDRFWRGADAAPGGSGIGLAIVRQLAEASGGNAQLDPRAGGGIDAVVTLPATRRPAAAPVLTGRSPGTS
jgi:signal transduction histidine kinase